MKRDTRPRGLVSASAERDAMIARQSGARHRPQNAEVRRRDDAAGQPRVVSAAEARDWMIRRMLSEGGR